MVNTIERFTEVHCEQANSFTVRFVKITINSVLHAHKSICAAAASPVGDLSRA